MKKTTLDKAIERLDQAIALAKNPVVRQYRKNRNENPTLPAIRAWEWAKCSVNYKRDEPEGFNTNGRPFEVDGFEITVNIEPDLDVDYSFYGEFVDDERDGAVKNPEAWTSHGNRNSHYIAYFVPMYSEAERFADAHKRGMDKQSAHLEARKGVMLDLEAAKEYSSYFAVVTASREGIDLGSDVLGGLDYDDPTDAIFEHDMIENAIAEAKAAIEKLTGAKK